MTEYDISELPPDLNWGTFRTKTKGQFTKKNYGSDQKASAAMSKAWKRYSQNEEASITKEDDEEKASITKEEYYKEYEEDDEEDDEKRLQRLQLEKKKEELSDKKEAHSINKKRIKLMEQQFLKESQYKKACEDRDIEEYKEYKRAVLDNVNATAFNRKVSEDNLKCMESVVADERNLKKQIIEQCLRGYRVNILHSESCAIPDEIKELQDAQNALKEKRKTLVKEFKECKTQLMNEWRDIFVNRNRFGQFIGWLRGDRPQSFMDAIDNGSKLHVEKMKYLISIFSKHRVS